MKCPLFIIHGKNDELIPPSHGEELYSECPSTCQLALIKGMGHSLTNIRIDLIHPISQFLKRLDAMNKTSSKVEELIGLRPLEFPRCLFATHGKINNMK